jgi:hypothetical protein
LFDFIKGLRITKPCGPKTNDQTFVLNDVDEWPDDQTLKNVLGTADSSVTDLCLDMHHMCVPHRRSSHAVETSVFFPLSPQTKIPGIFYDHHRKYLFLRMSKIRYHATTNPLSTLDCGIYALGQLHTQCKVYVFGLLFGLAKQKGPNKRTNSSI